MKLIDFENHFYDQSLINALLERAEPPYYRADTDIITWSDQVQMPQGPLLDKLLDVGENRLALMDQLGITCAVLSCSPGAEQLDPDTGVEVCRKTNDALYQLTQRYPGRYLGTAILPVQKIDAALEELERCVKQLGFVGWHTHSNYGATAPDDPCYRPLFHKAAELGIYVYLHPQLAHQSRVDDCGFPPKIRIIVTKNLFLQNAQTSKEQTISLCCFGSPTHLPYIGADGSFLNGIKPIHKFCDGHFVEPIQKTLFLPEHL